MPRGVKKEHLPSKTCVVCHRPFTWRKKWEAVWDDVTTCSKSCNRKRRAANQASNKQQRQENDESDNEEFVETGDVGAGRSSSRLSANADGLASLLPDDFTGLSISDTLSDATTDDFQHVLQQALADVADADSSSSDGENAAQQTIQQDPVRAARKAAKKQAKAQRRAQREGRADSTHGQKECTVCQKSVDLLIRCTIDQTADWNMVCGKCWKSVSGGVVDGDAAHPHYKYGGLWKNRAKR